MPDLESPVQEVDIETCWELLASTEIGRLAYVLVDEVHLVPVNYVVDDGTLLVRTAPGNKLLAAALGSAVAFEIDWYDESRAWSVEVRGRLRRLEEDEQHRIDRFERRPWVPTLKYEVVELVPDVVTGRRFALAGIPRFAP